MQIVLYVLGGLVILLVLVDVFVTIFSTSGAGPLTDRWTRLLWRALLALHRRRRIHQVLALTGPFMLLATIVVWYVLIGAGLLLVFAAHPGSVIDSSTNLPVDVIQKVYFVSTTISSLGYGDMVPSGFPWTLVATTGTFIATLVLTVSISYVISVIAAAIERKTLAQGIFGLGDSISEIIENARLDEPAHSLKHYITGIATTIDSHALKHLAYPILKYFHNPQADASPVRAILLFSDAFFVLGMRLDENSPPSGVERLVESSIRNYVQITRAVMPVQAPAQDPERLIARAYEYGIPIDAAFEKQLESYLPVRRRLLALCSEDGWYEQ